MVWVRKILNECLVMLSMVCLMSVLVWGDGKVKYSISSVNDIVSSRRMYGWNGWLSILIARKSAVVVVSS